MKATQQEIETWLKSNLAEQIGVAPGDIDPEQNFTLYGLDSMMALMLAGDLEEWLEIPISPTLAWDYQTIRSLSNHIATLLQTTPTA